jgi:hypothetical protein
MKAKIYYQDFYLNSRILNSAELKLDEKAAALMAELELDVATKAEFCEKAFRELNIGLMISSKVFQQKVQRQPFEGKHTSMSVGDYVKFEDGEIWMIAPIGYRQFTSSAKIFYL